MRLPLMERFATDGGDKRMLQVRCLPIERRLNWGVDCFIFTLQQGIKGQGRPRGNRLMNEADSTDDSRLRTV